MIPPTLVLDLGGGCLKLGNTSEDTPWVIDNCIYKSKTLGGRVFIGKEIDSCNNLSSLYCTVPFKKGYINNWDAQIQILDVSFKSYFKDRPYSLADSRLLITEPYFNFSSTKETINEVFFEDYQVAALVRTNPAFLVAHKYRAESIQRPSRFCLIVDTGYSYTHIVPLLDGKIMKEFTMRLTVGGKILTNRLIEMISYRQLDVRSELYIMNQCKEDACFVSTDFYSDMKMARHTKPSDNPILREYVLPDYSDVYRGYVREPSDASDGHNRSSKSSQHGYVLRLTNERFAVPELLFHPSDVGYSEMGITEAISYLLREKMPPGARPGAWANCVLVGGNACLPGFDSRLKQDLRSLAPDDLPVNVFKPEQPQHYAWQGGVLLAQNEELFQNYVVSRKEYEECGNSVCEQRFPVT